MCETDAFRGSELTYLFSNTALNTTKLKPLVSSNFDQLEDVVKWELFDELPRVAQIPQIGYGGVHKYFSNMDIFRFESGTYVRIDNPERMRESSEPNLLQNRKSYTMAEFLVKKVLPLECIKCLVTNPKSETQNKKWLKEQIDKTGYDVPVYENADFFFNLP